MPINELDNPHKTGVYEVGLKLLNFVLCFIAGPAVGIAVLFFTVKFLPGEEQWAPHWVHDYMHVFGRAEWFAFLFGAKLHSRIITRAIRFGPLTSKVYRASLLWPLMLTCAVALTCGVAFRYAYADIPYYLAPQGAQAIVWLAWESEIGRAHV